MSAIIMYTSSLFHSFFNQNHLLVAGTFFKGLNIHVTLSCITKALCVVTSNGFGGQGAVDTSTLACTDCEISDSNFPEHVLSMHSNFVSQHQIYA